MRYRELFEQLGAELLDFDVTRPATLEQQAELRRLFGQYHLLLIRGQNPSTQDQDRFTEYFGPLSLMKEGIPAGHVSNRPRGVHDEIVVTGLNRLLWHVDGPYGAHPGIGTSLLAIEVTPETTPTQFLSAERALDTLPPALRDRVDGLKAVHYRNLTREQTEKRNRVKELLESAGSGKFRSHEHPVVWRLPHIPTEVLFVNELTTSHISGMSDAEGEDLIQELFAHLYRDENIYTHYWQTGDIVIWDNIALQHCRPDELGTAPRHLRRLSLDGFYTEDGLLDWPASGTLRDTAALA